MADRTTDEYTLAQPCPRCGALPGEVCRSLVRRKARPRAHAVRRDTGARQYRLDAIGRYLDQAAKS